MDDEQRAEANDVRRWLLENHVATLATLSVDARCAGYPFCSIVPFALDRHGRPLVQIASIAAHTKNVRADPRASLFVHENTAGDPQAAWRVTLVGTMRPIDAQEHAEAMARLYERVPGALDYDKTHDFAVWRLDVEHVRYIAGFGRICWIDGKEALRDPLGAGLAEAAPGAIAHMNADHAAALIEICTARYGFTPAKASMVALDRAGFLVQTESPARLVHFSFDGEIEAAGLRHAVVGVVRRRARGEGRAASRPPG